MNRFPIVFASLFAAAAVSAAPSLEVRRAEDSRAADSTALRRAARGQAPAARREALRAMGRIQSPAYAEALIAAVKDKDSSARLEAIFSLGQLALAETPLDQAVQKRAGRELADVLARKDAPMRAAALEALGKIGGPGTERIAYWHLSDPDPSIRGEAALALFRLRYLKRITSYSPGTVSRLLANFSDPEPSPRWKAVYAFTRWPEAAAKDSLSVAAANPDSWVRLFAVRALGELRKEAPVDVLARSLGDLEPAIRAEAIRSLGLAGRVDLLGDAVFQDASAHVRAAAADALGAADAKALAHRLKPLLSEGSTLVRGQALLAAGKLLGEEAAALLSKERTNPDWWVRSRAFLASAALASARTELEAAVQDKDPRIGASALEALAQSNGPGLEPILGSILSDPASTLELRGTAADAAGEKKAPVLLRALARAWENSTGREWSEVRDSIKKAVEETAKAHPDASAVSLAPASAEPYREPEWLGRAGSTATVILKTGRGEIEIVLAPEAPIHGAAFLEGVVKGRYEKTPWHRVVTNFVVQGGDPRGSGWGDAGFSLRDEISPLKFERGVVGMPKAGKDTGGCQLFVTLVPTPHLDGRYTVFGRVTRGMDVVDLLEPGDLILGAALK